MLTQEQWYRKIRAWVPSWFWEQEHYNVALFNAIAKLLSEIDQTAQDHVNETFILRADGLFIDAQGDERNIPRNRNEPDPLYAHRVQLLTNHSDIVSIKKLVDALLVVGECIILEHFVDGPYLNRGTFCNRNGILNNHRYYNYFTVLIPRQLPPSNSYASRDAYDNRSNFLGTIGILPTQVLLESINAVIMGNKAAGVMYRLLEL